MLVRKALEEPGQGRVLVVDGGGSLRCALLGDNIAAMAHQNGWAGVIVHGCIRDAEAIARIPIGVKALATHPRKSAKKGAGDRDVAVTFAGVTWVPGELVYADHDGIVCARPACLRARARARVRGGAKRTSLGAFATPREEGARRLRLGIDGLGSSQGAWMSRAASKRANWRGRCIISRGGAINTS